MGAMLEDDLRERLLEQRTVLLTGPLVEADGTGATAALMLLDSRGDEPVELRLMGRDGDLDIALALADTIDGIGTDVRVHAMGVVGGALLAPFAAGTRRLASPNATFILTAPRPRPSGAGDVTIEAANHERQKEILYRRLAAACGVKLKTVVDDMRRGLVLNADEANAYGLVDAVVAPRP